MSLITVIRGLNPVRVGRETGFKPGTIRVLNRLGEWLLPNPGVLPAFQPVLAGGLGPINLAFATTTPNNGGSNRQLSPELARQKNDLIGFFSLGGVTARHQLENLAFAFDAMAQHHQNELLPDGTKVTTHLINIAEVIGRWGGGPETAAAALVQKLPGSVLPRLGLATATNLVLQQKNAAEAFLLIPLQNEKLTDQEADYLAKICLLKEDNPAVWLLIAATYLKTIPIASAAEKALLASRSHQVLPILLRLFNLEKAAMELEDTALFHWDRADYERWEQVLTDANTQERRAEVQYLRRLTDEISELLQTELGSSSFRAEYNVKSVTQTKKKLGRGDTLTDPSRFRYIIDGSRQDCLTAFYVIYDWLIGSGYQLEISEFKNYIQGLYIPEFTDHNFGPKANGYESLHALFCQPSTGKCLSIQIRTREMHEVAESGSASHVSYKAETQGTINPDLALALKKDIGEFDRRYGTINGRLYRAIPFHSGAKLTLLDLALASGPQGLAVPENVILKRIDPKTGEVVSRKVPVTEELHSGDQLEFSPLARPINPRKRLKQVGSLQGWLLLKLASESLINKDSTQIRYSEAVAKGRLLAELAIAPEENLLREKMSRILKAERAERVSPKVWFSAERIAGKLGLPTEEALYLSIAYTKDRDQLLADVRRIMAGSTITSAYQKTSAGTANSWLLVNNIPGLLKKILEQLEVSGLKVLSLENSPLDGGLTLIKFTVSDRAVEDQLLSFFQRVSDLYRGLHSLSSGSSTNRLMIKFDLKGLVLSDLIALTSAFYRLRGNIYRASFPPAYEGRSQVSIELDVPKGMVERSITEIRRSLSGQATIRNLTINQIG